MDFSNIRLEWSLKIPVPSAEDIKYQMEADRIKNPYNDPYLNKCPRRGISEIISDTVFQEVDTILERQYGAEYTTWLSQQGFILNRHTNTYTKGY